MIQDMLSTGRFRWSLAPTSMVESERFLSVQWDSIPPSECGACDGLQGAILNIAQFYTYPEPPPACEEQTVFPKCVRFIFTFYQLRSGKHVFAEASYVRLVKQELISALKDCGGGGKTSAVTAIAQLLFWKQTAEEFRTIGKPFLLDPGPKTIAADPSLCEDGEPPPPPPDSRPKFRDTPFPIDNVEDYPKDSFLRLGVVTTKEEGGPEIRTIPDRAWANLEVATISFTNRSDSMQTFACNPDGTDVRANVSGVQGVFLRNRPNNTVTGQQASYNIGDCESFYEVVGVVGIVYNLMGEEIGSFDILRIGPPPPPPPLLDPPPPEENCLLYRQVVKIEVIVLNDDPNNAARTSVFTLDILDEITCSANPPLPFDYTKIGELLAGIRVIGLRQTIQYLGRCSC